MGDNLARRSKLQANMVQRDCLKSNVEQVADCSRTWSIAMDSRNEFSSLSLASPSEDSEETNDISNLC